jgi:hypothetical protein
MVVDKDGNIAGVFDTDGTLRGCANLTGRREVGTFQAGGECSGASFDCASFGRSAQDAASAPNLKRTRAWAPSKRSATEVAEITERLERAKGTLRPP